MEGNIRLNQAIAADNAVDASTCQWGDGWVYLHAGTRGARYRCRSLPPVLPHSSITYYPIARFG